MTVSTTNNRINQVADGIEVSFIYDYIVNDASHMFPYLDNVLQSAGFTVNGVGNPAGGNVTFDVAPANDVVVTLQRVVPLTQLVDYLPYDPFPAETHEGALDKLTLQLQQVSDEISRAIKADVTAPAGISYTLPLPEAGSFLQWNLTEDGFINVNISDLGDLVVTTPYTELFLTAADSAAARATLQAAGLNVPNILNGINTFNDKAIFNGVAHQSIGSDIASAATLPNITDGNYASVTALAAGITGATQANPVVITAIAHGLSNGNKVTLADVGGMIEINGTEYTVANVTTDTFELSGIDGTGFTAYTTGGSIWASILELETTGEVGTIIRRKFNGTLVLTDSPSNLILFNDSNIITNKGDVATFIEFVTGNFKLINYAKLDGKAVVKTSLAIAESDFSSGLLYQGSGDDGAKTVSTSEDLDSGEYHYTSLTIDSGQTLGVTESAGGWLLIRCSGAVIINGTIDLAGKGAAGAPAQTVAGSDGITGSSGSGGGSGGSGGSSDSVQKGGAGGDSILRSIILAGGAQSPNGPNGDGNIGVGTTARMEAIIQAQVGAELYAVMGAGGGSGGYRTTATGGAGGNGGGGLIIIADTIEFQSGANIACDGADGANGIGIAGAGGGGGGGVAILAANTVVNDGTITVTGGIGGDDSAQANLGVGGAGGNGYSAVIV